MKLMVILLLVAVSHALDLQSQKTEANRTERREVSKGNSVVDKRAPAISTASPAITPGIEYADSKESQHDKSPTHQIYATPLPPVSKISDVLTGQGPAFQSAIASHLYAPISVYQTRLGSYEVSAPVSSNLAYAEHRISLQPSQNAVQFSQKPLQKSKNFQQILVQQQPLAYSQPLGPAVQPVYQQIPQVYYQDIPINQFQIPLNHGQQPVYQEQPVQIAQPVQSGNAYAPELQQGNHQPAQGELKPQPGSKTPEKQVVTKNYVQPQGAVSFAKYSQLQPAFALQPQHEVQYQLQPQPQPQQQPHPQLQLQPQYHQPQAQYRQQLQDQPQQQQYQLLQQPQIQYQPLQQYQILPQIEQSQQIQPLQYQLQPEQAQQQSQPQIQYHSQPQLPQPKRQSLPQLQNQPLPQSQHQQLPQLQPQQQQQLQLQQQQQLQHQQQQQQIQLQPIPKPALSGKISYLRPGPVFLQSQYPQSQAASDYRSNVALPTFPPVQYFGKYAQSIFGNLQH